MTYQKLIVEREENIATLTLNRPERLNALNLELIAEAISALEEVTVDEGIKALIITGAGRSFCAGGDVREALGMTVEGVSTRGFADVVHIAFKLRNMNKPVIAAINGIAYGAGFSLALACDIRIASEDGQFSMPFILRGVIPDLGGTFFLPKIVGTAKACELILTGDTIDAAEAERLGLVNKIVPHDELMKEAKNLANWLGKGPPIAMASAKRAVYRGFTEADLAGHMDYEICLSRLCVGTEDFKEGVTAFLEKRRPTFKGR